MKQVKLSQKYQLVVPSDVRRAMHLDAGSLLSIEPIDDDRALLIRYPQRYATSLRGLGKQVWKTLGGTRRYIQTERAVWEK